MTQKSVKVLIDEIYSKPPKRNISQMKLMFIILMIFGTCIF